MKITILSGSPKGELSISLQYFRFIAKHNTDINYNVFHIGESIKLIDKNESELLNIVDSITNSDAVIWVFPVYHFLVPSQLKQFIEIINEKNFSHYFKGKYSTSIISSIHFYDNMAENYIHNISEDLGMKYISGFLADMHDLTKYEKQSELLDFGKRFFDSIQKEKIVSKTFRPVENNIMPYSSVFSQNIEKTSNYKILLITDNSHKKGNLKNMVDIFIKKCKNQVTLINLDELETKGGCLGCCKCGYDNICIYNDEMDYFLHNSFLNSDAIIIASEIKDRYLSWQIKRLWDRSFTHGHKPAIAGKQFLYIISGSISENSILKSEIEARCGVSRTTLVDIVCDEFLSSEEITQHLVQAGDDLIESIQMKRKAQVTFHFTAGHKIFRDFVYLMKFVFKADHDYYRKNSFYDFPQKKIGLRISNRLLLILLKIKPFREVFQSKIKPSMVKNMKKIAD